MGFLSFLSAGGKAAENVTDIGKTVTNGIVSGLDALVYTDEEKDENKKEGAKIILQFWDKIAQENTEQSKARRELAKMTMQVYYGLILMGILVWPFMKEYAGFIFGAVKEISILVGMVAAIYFGPHQLSKIVGKK